MSVINNVLNHKISQFILSNIDGLEGRAKFCAYNSIRYLNWANDIFEVSHIISAFCALHATEEAIAAFVSTAKEGKYQYLANELNLHDHKSKAMISILAQRYNFVASNAKLAINVHPNNNCLLYRIPNLGEHKYGELHLSSFTYSDTDDEENHGIFFGELPSLENIEAESRTLADARNKLLYASNHGYPSGFKEPKPEIIRETQKSLALIWAAIDLKMNPEQTSNFVKFTLDTLVSIQNRRKK